MLRLLGVVLRSAVAALRTRRRLALENLALRQQLSVLLATSHRRSALTDLDGAFWTILRCRWTAWSRALLIVQPETVVRWHRQGFRRYWRRKSRRRPGRPRVDPKIRALIRRIATANPLWGAPRIHGELLKLGIEILCLPETRLPRNHWLSWRPRALALEGFETLLRTWLLARPTAAEARSDLSCGLLVRLDAAWILLWIRWLWA